MYKKSNSRYVISLTCTKDQIVDDINTIKVLMDSNCNKNCGSYNYDDVTESPKFFPRIKDHLNL